MWIHEKVNDTSMRIITVVLPLACPVKEKIVVCVNVKDNQALLRVAVTYNSDFTDVRLVTFKHLLVFEFLLCQVISAMSLN